jgi:Cu2+-exporting ATPase
MLITAALLLGGYAVLVELWPHRKAKAAPLTLPPEGAQSDGSALAPASAVAVESLGGLSTGAGDDLTQLVAEAQVPLWVAGLGFALGGVLFYPPLTLLALPPLLLNLYPFIRESVAKFRRGEQRAIIIIDLLGIVGALALNQILLATVLSITLDITHWLIRRTEDRSRRRLFGIYELLPDRVWLDRDGAQLQVPLKQVNAGDIVVIDAGQTVPIDGVVLSGLGRFDERSFTGESQLVEKGQGCKVRATTLLVQGRVRVQVENTGESCLASQIVTVLNQSRDYREEVRSRGQRIVERGAVPTLVLAGIAFAIGGPVSGLAMLFAGFGYSMRYMAPLAVLGFLEQASRDAILVKDGRALELLAEVDTVLFDKTGTLTTDKLQVEQVISISQLSEVQLLAMAASAEHRQRHPIGQAIVDSAVQRGCTIREPDTVGVEVGSGLRSIIDGHIVLVGNEKLLASEGITIPPSLRLLETTCTARGSTLVYVSCNVEVVGAIELSSILRPEAAAAIAALRQRNIDVYIVSGDHEGPTQDIARRLGIPNYFARVLPTEKAAIVKGLQDKGKKVCFVGDGINDAIALRQADVSISLAGASTMAKDSAPIILTDGQLSGLPLVFELSVKLRRNLSTGEVLSVAPGVLAAGGILTGTIALVGAILWYNVTLAISFGNALRPMLAATRRQTQDDSDRTVLNRDSTEQR